jgi:thiamine-monophosphate kinase
MAGEVETTLIERYFRHLGSVRTDVVLGIGDDAALLRAPPGHELALTTDSLVEGVHFHPGAPPRSLGHRALAVNLSDLAAMGATPCWALLSLSLPAIDEAWLGEFSTGFGLLARSCNVALVGGNLSRGPLNITVQLCGAVPSGTALRRSGARPGHELWVSGTLGDAAAGLQLGSDAGGGAMAGMAIAAGTASVAEREWLRGRFEFPTPRLALGQALRGIASSCMDVSDGLLADAARLAEASGCGAIIQVEQLPVSAALRAHEPASSWQRALQGGEDYELCFTAPPEQATRLQQLATELALPLTPCGTLQAAAGLVLRSGSSVIQFSQSSFEHFIS